MSKTRRAAKPKYRAYKPVTRKLGLTIWIDHRFDMRKPFTDDDLRALRATADVGTPRTRIREMQERLDRLGANLTADIKLCVDAIRDIHTRVAVSGDATREELYLLDKADWLWTQILWLRDAMPKVEASAKAQRTATTRAAEARIKSTWGSPEARERLRRIIEARLMERKRCSPMQWAREYGVNPETVKALIDNVRRAKKN